MNGHISDELPRLLTGEASRDDVVSAAAHLRECPDCQHELVTAVVAHASLTSANRFAREVVTAERSEPVDDVALPDLSVVFAQVRKEADSPIRHVRSRVRHLPARTLILAASAAVLVGAGVGMFVAVNTGSSGSGHVVALSAFHEGRTSATARIDGGHVSVDASSLPTLAGKRYEVWLTNAARSQMQPIGWIGLNGKASMTVPADLISRFSDIEVSVQPVSSPSYQYSNVSVLRGAYSE